MLDSGSGSRLDHTCDKIQAMTCAQLIFVAHQHHADCAVSAAGQRETHLAVQVASDQGGALQGVPAPGAWEASCLAQGLPPLLLGQQDPVEKFLSVFVEMSSQRPHKLII